MNLEMAIAIVLFIIVIGGGSIWLFNMSLRSDSKDRFVKYDIKKKKEDKK